MCARTESGVSKSTQPSAFACCNWAAADNRLEPGRLRGLTTLNPGMDDNTSNIVGTLVSVSSAAQHNQINYLVWNNSNNSIIDEHNAILLWCNINSQLTNYVQYTSK